MITDFNDSVADLSSGDDSGHATKELKPSTAKAVVNSDDNRSKASSNKVRPGEKTVRFDDTIGIFHLDAAREKKQVVWYDSDDFKRFKHEAAEEAGLKLIPCDPEKSGKGHFAMVGDFDIQIKPADASSASKNAKKLYYNENEYSDSHDGNEDTICMRGLGYHFSRNRKKSRVVTRYAVLTWQKMLCDSASQANPEPQQNLSATRDGGVRRYLKKTRAVLVLVSAKCSRVARADARWRGDVDYKVAYPERHAATLSSSSPTRPQSMNKSSAVDAAKSNGATRVRSGTLKKRMRGDANAFPHAKIATCKRRRTSSGARCSAMDGLSSSSINGASGMLRANA